SLARRDLLPFAAFLQRRDQDRQDDAILRSAGLCLRRNQRRQVEYMEQSPFIAYRDAVRQQLFVALPGIELAERIDRSQRRGQVDLSPPGKHLGGRAKASAGQVVAHGRIEAEQDLE